MSQNSSLLSLPLELFLIVSTHLDVTDIENLAMTCKDMSNFVRRVFVTRVVMPLSEHSMAQLGGSSGRCVLSLASSVNIRLWGERGYEEMLKKMNLKFVKNVKFVGNNYSVGFGEGEGLISGYKSIMENIFLCKKFVRKLDISIDSSEECYRQLDRLKEMPCLEELCLRSSGLRAQFNETMPEDRTLNRAFRSQP